LPIDSQSELRQGTVDPQLYESSPDCIKILRLDGTIKHLSPGGHVALELDRPDQLDDLSWPSLWPGSEQARVAQAVEEGRDGKRTQFLAFCPTAKNTPRWWDVVVTPMPGVETAVSGLLVVSRDVTELVRAREGLAQANARKDEFLAVLSHELRNPLSALAMAAKVLETLHGELPQVAKLSELIHRQVGHMSRLTEDLLDVARIARGEVHLRVEEFDLRDSVGAIAEQLKPALTAKNQRLRIALPANPVVLRGDRTRLTQVLGNLVGNASRYSSPASAIDVAIEADDEVATIRIVDHGQGIAPDLMPVLFDMYSQGQATPDRRASGVGLGLAIVKGLVELHGGTIRAESAGADQGSTFIVVLPRRFLTGDERPAASSVLA
jgi:signal transduction histidine kinase